MAYNSNKGPQHTGDLQYEGDPNDVQIDFENDEIALKTGGVQRVVLTNAELSSSGIFRSVGSLSGSGDIAVSGAMHAANFYGVGAGISGVTATAVSGTTAQLTTGVETSGYLKVTGSSTLSVLTVTTLSASGATHTDGVTTIGNTLATAGSITAGTTVTATTTLLGNTLDIGGSDFIVTANGVVSGSGTLTCTSLSASGESHFSGNVGIGIANPNYDLHVNGAGATVVAIDGGASADAYLKFATNGTEKAHIKQGSGGNTIITNDVAGKNLQLQARPSAGAASTYIFLDGASESVLVAKPVSGSNTLHHVGAATFGSTIAATGSLTATGVYSTDLISGSLGMHIDAPATFGADIATSGSMSGSSTLQAVGATTLGNNLTVSGTTNLKALVAQATQATTISASSALQAVGATVLGNTLHVSGAATLAGQLTVINGVAAEFLGNTTFGNAAADTVTFTANSKFNAPISSSTTFHNVGTSTFGAPVACSGSVTAVGLYSTELISGSLGLHVDQPASFGDIVTVTASVGVGIAAPKTALDVHHNPTTLDNDTGGGEVVKFGTGTLTTGKMYYLHTGSSWEQTDSIIAASGGVGLLGIAVGSNPATNGLLVRGFYDVHSYLSGAFAAGQPVYVSAPGYITTMRPSGSTEIVRQVGYCTTTANVIYFNPSSEYIELV